jgi:hypothetical protein
MEEFRMDSSHFSSNEKCEESKKKKKGKEHAGEGDPGVFEE